MPEFQLVAPYEPAGDQPQAIEKLVEGFRQGRPHQTLLGVTGTGKTFTMANVIAQLGKPTLVLSHNKTLAAQLYKEFKELLPAQRRPLLRQLLRLLPARGLHPPARHLHREGRLDQREHRPPAPGRHQRPGQPRGRHHRRQRLVHLRPRLARATTRKMMVRLKGETIDRDELLLRLVDIQYERNDVAFERGKFRVRGDVVEVWPAYEEFGLPHRAVRRRGRDPRHHQPADRRGHRDAGRAVHLPGQALRHARGARSRRPSRRSSRSWTSGSSCSRSRASCSKRSGWPRGRATTWRCCWRSATAPASRTTPAALGPQAGRAAVHAARLLPRRLPDDRRRVARDACRRSAACSPATTAARARWSSTASACPAPWTIGRSASTSGRRSSGQRVFMSATPGAYELAQSGGEVVEQVIRPTGLVDPLVHVEPARGQVPDLVERDPEAGRARASACWSRR